MGRSILNVASGGSSTTDKLVKVHYHKWAVRTGNDNLREDVMWRTGAFTTTTTNATLIVTGQMWGRHAISDHCGVYAQLIYSSNNNNVLTGYADEDGERYYGIGYAGVNKGTDWGKYLLQWYQVLPNVAAGTYKIDIGWRTRADSTDRPFTDYNINNTDDARSRQHDSTCEIWELEPSQGLTNTNLAVSTW